MIGITNQILSMLMDFFVFMLIAGLAIAVWLFIITSFIKDVDNVISRFKEHNKNEKQKVEINTTTNDDIGATRS